MSGLEEKMGGDRLEGKMWVDRKGRWGRQTEMQNVEDSDWKRY